MTETNPPNYVLGPPATAAEAMAVTLGRIDIRVGFILEKVRDVQAEVVLHRDAIGVLRSEVQQLQSDQRAANSSLQLANKAREETALALEKQTKDAVDKAKDAVDSEARQTAALGVKTVTTWAPRNFGIALAMLVVATLAAYAAFKFGASTPTPVR